MAAERMTSVTHHSDTLAFLLGTLAAIPVALTGRILNLLPFRARWFDAICERMAVGPRESWGKP